MTTPSALRAYLRHSGEASLPELAAHFGADAGLIRDVIAYWQKKGRIRESAPGCDKACAQCGEGAIFYRWREQETEASNP